MRKAWVEASEPAKRTSVYLILVDTAEDLPFDSIIYQNVYD
jgi:hypothetical protein